MNSVTHLSDTFLESRISFGEDLLLNSASLRHHDCIYRDEVIPQLASYNEQVAAARSLISSARWRALEVFRLADKVLAEQSLAGVRRRNLSPVAEEEFQYLQNFLRQEGLFRDAKTLNLKDLGWSPAWRDPHPRCEAFQNSITTVDNMMQVLSLADLWEYGLVPSDLDDFYNEMMQQAGYITDVTDALLAKHDGDWRAMLRDDSLAGQPLC